MSITIRDVARKAGVSVTTVSRTLNNRGYISKETREKIYAVIQDLNYSPNMLARSLTRAKTQTIGLVVPSINHPFFAQIAQQIEHRFFDLGYQVLLRTTEANVGHESRILDLLQQARVDGIIIGSPGLSDQDYAKSTVPIISFDMHLASASVSIAANHALGGRMAAQALLRGGCRRVLQIVGDLSAKTDAARRHQTFLEEMIAAGQVQVNGITITEMGTQVEDGDEVRVDGQVIHPEAEKKYVIYHKPAGEVTTVNDPEGRACVLDHFRDYPVRLYPVGRLDYDSEGLLLLTNDGALTERMLHPSHQVDKTYLARVTGSVSLDTVRLLRQGVMLDDHKTAPAKVRIVKTETFATVVLVTIHEGRNRQVRRMFEEAGHKVLQLRRVRFGPLELGDLPRGQWRELTPEEERKLMAYL